MSFSSKLPNKSRKDISREGALDEMSTLARVAVFICRIGGLITGFWAAGCTAAILVMLFYSFTGYIGQFVSDGANGILFQLSDPTHDDLVQSFVILGDGSPIVTKGVFNLLCCWAFGSAIDFFKAISKSGRPFERARAHELQRSGALLVLGSLISGPLGIISIILVSRLPGTPLNWSITDTIQVGPLAVGIIVFVFARILEYGCVLQEQDDALL